jgi:hypothetical protein
MSTLGRISGQMLKANLERLGVDLAFENDLLYLDVVNNKIGVSTSIAPRELTINGTTVTTDLIVDTGYLQVVDTIINGATGDISSVGNATTTVNAHSGNVNLSELNVNSLNFNNSTIQTTDTNTNLELRVSGTGRVEFGTDDSSFTDVRVRENLHAVGDITLDGNITFGDSSAEDNVTFVGKIDSDIMPSVTDLYNIGSPTKKWREIHARTINGEFLQTTDFGVPGITTISARPGNTWYVSAEEGDDTFVGDHQMGPFRTIEHALSQATAGDQVYIYAGEYEEYFPLTVPKGVTVQGEGIRSVKIYPHTSHNDKDAFLLNGETTVENLTVSDFYYNSTNNTGYAFRFANNFQVDTRSPYIRNVTVLTHSDSSNESAGRGALVDGSVATSSSIEASMLFHSVTMLTPGNIALYMTNGVRVEWLNSFTYFASKGLYATNGATGRLTPDGSTIKKGAELRSIGSANVYGTVGAEADGNECLMYLIQHNFAYVGAGTDVENDPTLVTQNTETVEVASGKIYYQSVDQDGDFRVGEAFTVQQDTGFITANGLGGGALGVQNVSFSDGVNNTDIDASSVDTGNIQLTQNDINTIGGDLNVNSSSGSTTLDSDVTIQNGLTVDGDMIVNGAVSFGDSSQQGGGSQISFDAPISIDLQPTFDVTYNLGNDLESWSQVFTKRYLGEDIQIFQNRITTTRSSSNLDLSAAGTGVVQFVSPVQIANNLSTGDANLQNVDITGNLTQTGNTTQTGNKTVSGNYTLSGFLNLNDDLVPFDDIKIAGNKITTTESNSNLQLDASGTGNILFRSSVDLNRILTVNGTLTTNGITNNQYVRSYEFFTDGLHIFQNNIIGTSNDNIELRSTGTGVTYVRLQDDVDVTQDLEVSGTTSLSNTTITGTLDVTGETTLIGDADIQGTLIVNGGNLTTSGLYLGNIRVDTNVITTTESNSDLELRASGTGRVITNERVLVENTIDVRGALDFQSLTAVNSVTASEFYTDQILIKDNFITTTNSNSDLELRASGTGDVVVSETDVQVDTDITVSLDTDLNDTGITGTLTHTGIRNVTGTYTNIGNFTVTNDVTIDGYLQGDDVRFETNYISTTQSNSDLELRANGTGKVVVNNTDVDVTNDLTVVGDIFTTNANITNTLTFDRLEQNEIVLDNNFITTTTSNADLELRASGTGSVVINDDLTVTNEVFATSVSAPITSIPSLLIVNGTIQHSGNITRTGTTTFNTPLTVNNNVQFENIKIDDNVITTTDSNSDLELRAAGTGEVLIDRDVTVGQNLTVLGETTLAGDFTVSSIVFNSISNGNILVDDNFITTTLSNSDLDLRANGAGILLFDSNEVQADQDLSVLGITDLLDTNITGTFTHNGNATHTGNYTNNGAFRTTQNLVTSGDPTFSNIRFNNNVIETLDSNADLELRADGNGKVAFDSDFTIIRDLDITGDATTNNVTVYNTLTAPTFETSDDIRISTNTITTTSSNSNLHIRASGVVEADNIIFDNNIVKSKQTDSDIVFEPDGNLDVSTSGPVGYTATLPITGSMYLAAGADYSLNEDRLLGIVSADLRDWANAFNGQTVTINLTGQTSGTASITGTLVYTSGDSYLAVTPNTLPSGMTFQYYDVTGLTPNSASPGTTNFILPQGTLAESSAIDGAIRFDTELQKFTGHISGVKPFGGVYSADRQTSVTVSDSRFYKNNQTINFVNNGINTAHIDSIGITTLGLQLDDINIDTNVISSSTNTDINIIPNGTGDVILDDTIIRGDDFENQSTTAPLTVRNTQDGYVKFNSKTSLVIPTGTDGQRSPTPQVGEIRYNTDGGGPEVYNGTSWATWAGSSVTATEAEIDDISNIMAILLG